MRYDKVFEKLGDEHCFKKLNFRYNIYFHENKIQVIKLWQNYMSQVWQSKMKTV